MPALWMVPQGKEIYYRQVFGGEMLNVCSRVQAGLRGEALAVRSHGFTLVEIMGVVVILGILAAVIGPRVLGRADEARAVAAKQDVAAVMQALKLYRLDNGRYPTT